MTPLVIVILAGVIFWLLVALFVWALARMSASCEEDYVACSGCGLRNYHTSNQTWNCPDYPNCREVVPWQ